MWRSKDSKSAMASSATAIELVPGQLHTATPFWAAWAVSIVSYPAPARIISFNLGAASITAAGTLVLRTIKICVSATAWGRVVSSSAGLVVTA